jgi:hypothetical protein
VILVRAAHPALYARAGVLGIEQQINRLNWIILTFSETIININTQSVYRNTSFLEKKRIISLILKFFAISSHIINRIEKAANSKFGKSTLSLNAKISNN